MRREIERSLTAIREKAGSVGSVTDRGAVRVPRQCGRMPTHVGPECHRTRRSGRRKVGDQLNGQD